MSSDSHTNDDSSQLPKLPDQSTSPAVPSPNVARPAKKKPRLREPEVLRFFCVIARAFLVYYEKGQECELGFSQERWIERHGSSVRVLRQRGLDQSIDRFIRARINDHFWRWVEASKQLRLEDTSGLALTCPSLTWDLVLATRWCLEWLVSDLPWILKPEV
jgi:hypothetical protein